MTLAFSNSPKLDVEGRVVWKQPRNANGVSVNDLGILLMNRDDAKMYEEAVSKADKRALPDRRSRDRRAAQTNPPSAERRRRDRRGTVSMKNRLSLRSQMLDRWFSNHTYERVMQSGAGPVVTSRDRILVNLGSNSYLGLTDHPKVKQAAIEAVAKYGAGAGGVRYLSGTQDIHKMLEERIARFKGAEACLVFPSGYVSNFALLSSILEPEDVVFNDILNHASIVDGCRNTKAKTHFYKHADVENLEKKLQRYESDRPKLIITDGVFSMDGDVAPLKEIIDLARKYNAMVMVDDAHATGVIGAGGHGTAEYCGVFGQVDITIATLSKALGTIGGAICGSRALIKTVFHKSRQFIFTSAIPPSVCASVIAGLDVIESEPGLVANVHRNQKFLCNGLKEMGYDALDTPSALIPVMIGPGENAWALASLLQEMGVFVNAVTEPAVAQDKARLRVSVMATQTLEQLQIALECFKKAGRRLNLIP